MHEQTISINPSLISHNSLLYSYRPRFNPATATPRHHDRHDPHHSNTPILIHAHSAPPRHPCHNNTPTSPPPTQYSYSPPHPLLLLTDLTLGVIRDDHRLPLRLLPHLLCQSLWDLWQRLLPGPPPNTQRVIDGRQRIKPFSRDLNPLPLGGFRTPLLCLLRLGVKARAVASKRSSDGLRSGLPDWLARLNGRSRQRIGWLLRRSPWRKRVARGHESRGGGERSWRS